MADMKTDGISPNLFSELGNKLNTVRSNRSLVAANQQLRIQLSLAKAEVNRLRNEIVELQRRIAELESAADEERIEIVVRSRLQQRVQHLKSITNRTVQYMKKTKADFDHAANRLDHALNFGSDNTCTDEYSRSVALQSAHETGSKNFVRRGQLLKSPALEVVEEDIYGELDEDEDSISEKSFGRRGVMLMDNAEFIQSSDNRISDRNSRRQTFFVKKEPVEFEDETDTSFAELSFPKTSQSASSLMSDGDLSAVAVSTDPVTPTSTSISKTPPTSSGPEILTTYSKSAKFSTPETPNNENKPTKVSIRNEIDKVKVVTHIKTKKISTGETPKKRKRSSENNARSPVPIEKSLTVPTSTPCNDFLSAESLTGSVRQKRAAAAKISSFKEPSLVTKMRNSNLFKTKFSRDIFFFITIDKLFNEASRSGQLCLGRRSGVLVYVVLLLMLRIGDSYVIFESGGALSDIFYDDVNRKIVTVRGDGIAEVRAYGLEADEAISFRLKSRGKIRIIKFSPDKRLVCIQYDDSVVDFINFATLSVDPLFKCFSQSTKNRSAHIIGLEWILNNQILYITNQGLELYQVNPEKKSAKLLKSYNISLYWYLYYPNSQLLIVSCGVAGALLNPFTIQNGSIYRLMKFEVEFGHSNTKQRLLEREVFIISIYNALYIAILRNSTRDSTSSDIVLYKMSKDGMEVPKLAHTLCLDMVGAFALHAFNNLVVVHHQSSKTSLIFDIGLEEARKNDCISYPLFRTSLNCSDLLQAKFSHEFKLYSPSWVMFQPNFITDANVGVFTSVSLDPVGAENFIEDKYQYLHFLYNRCVPKPVFLENLKQCIVANKLKLKQLTQIFNWFAKATAKRSLPILRHSDSGFKYVLVAESYEEIVIEQGDIVGNLFLLPDDYTFDQKQRFLQYMLRYLTALRENKLEVQPYFLNEIFVPTMITMGQLERLHQLLLYRIIPDSKQLAFQLLSHEAKYPPLVQLALDMLSRLGTATEEIVEVLMARNLVVEAIRFLESSQSADKVNGLKLIESAWEENRLIRYAVFSYFLERSSKTRNDITNSGQFEEFSKKFEALFDSDEIKAAKTASDVMTTSSKLNQQ
uniref:Mic1 domain-containing protein n=1 Tax=Setaria digitata TaxID=48799 RepID=A0A915PCH9_9BILA